MCIDYKEAYKHGFSELGLGVERMFLHELEYNCILLKCDIKRAIQIMTKAAELYKDNLEDQKVLFLYGVPFEIKKQLQQEEKNFVE